MLERPAVDGGAPLRILHQDEALVVVDKPSGMLVHRTPGTPDRTAVLQLARDATGGAHLFPVHRLDRGASGVLVLARAPDIARVVHAQLADGGAEKRYLALVRGAPPAEGLIDHPIPRRPDGPPVPAVTAYRCLAVVQVPFVDRRGEARAQSYAVVEAQPRSGRLHQVRRHLKHLGHPLLGDVNYGRGEHNRWCRERYGLVRLALHAAALTIVHPATGRPARFAAALPVDLRRPLEAMGFDLAGM